MPIEIIALVGLVLLFVVTMAFGVNMGAVAFVATFAVCAFFAGTPIEEAISDGFPTGLFVTLVGVTYLFAIARENGTITWLIDSGVRAVRGRLGLVPWVLFVITGLLAMAGAPLVAVIAVVAPVALEFSRRYQLHPLLMGLMVVNGGAAGGLAPTSVLGSICREVAERNGVALDPTALFLGSVAFNIVLGVAGFLIFGGRRLLGVRIPTNEQSATSDDPDQPDPLGTAGPSHPAASGPSTVHSDGPVTAVASPATAVKDQELPTARTSMTPLRVTTLVGLIILAGGGLAFDMDVGILAMTVAVVLSVLSPRIGKAAVSQVAWTTVLLVCGTLTYIALLQEVGTIDFLGRGVVALGVPALGVLLICAIGAVGSAIASTIGMLGALVPLAVPLVTSSDLNPTAVITALAISALVVDASPLSSTGALVVANSPAETRESVFRQLLCWGGAMVIVAPFLTWLLFILPSG